MVNPALAPFVHSCPLTLSPPGRIPIYLWRNHRRPAAIALQLNARNSPQSWGIGGLNVASGITCDGGP